MAEQSVLDVERDAEGLRDSIRAYSTTLLPAGRIARAERLKTDLKQAAQRAARSATANIEDRRLRRDTKARVYQHILPLLESQVVAAQAVMRRYRIAVFGLTAINLVALAIVALHLV